jgi:hypothetical protein
MQVSCGRGSLVLSALAHGLMETIVILAAGFTGLSGLFWMIAALAGAAVFILRELDSRERLRLSRSRWQIGPCRSAAGAAFIRAGQRCLGWSVGVATRLLVGA